LSLSRLQLYYSLKPFSSWTYRSHPSYNSHFWNWWIGSPASWQVTTLESVGIWQEKVCSHQSRWQRPWLDFTLHLKCWPYHCGTAGKQTQKKQPTGSSYFDEYTQEKFHLFWLYFFCKP